MGEKDGDVSKIMFKDVKCKHSRLHLVDVKEVQIELFQWRA